MASMLGKHAEAAARYAEGITLSRANRTPVALEAGIEATLAGPVSLRFEAPAGPQQPQKPLGPLRWHVGAAAARPAYKGALAHADDAWVRISLEQMSMP